ncbi:MAG: hypothetical protein FXV80_06575, partial [Candidatus Thioglobus sp.]
ATIEIFYTASNYANSHNKFIHSGSDQDSDWIGGDSDGNYRKTLWGDASRTDICPADFRVPNDAEIGEFREEIRAIGGNFVDAAFNSFLKFPAAGQRRAPGGALQIKAVGNNGALWSGTQNSDGDSQALWIRSGQLNTNSNRARFEGLSVRCIQDAITNPVPVTPLTIADATFSINENNAANAEVGIVATTGTPTALSITAGNTNSIFAISTAGVISVTNANALDYETAALYTLTVTATKAGTPNATAQITININDVNETPTSFSFNGVTYDIVISATGRTWLDRNLGANQVATAIGDAASFGDFYQWGRPADGHQLRTTSTTDTLADSITPTN